MALEERTQLATEGIVVAAVEVARPPPPRPTPEADGAGEVRAGAAALRRAAEEGEGARGVAGAALRLRAGPGPSARQSVAGQSGHCGVHDGCLSSQMRAMHPSDGQCGPWGRPPAAARRACERDPGPQGCKSVPQTCR
jgi:hypothetical protein